ncbi:hypothetical protein G7Z17_g1112 [Cylindrodendrum hubeiense]|uniref:Serine carboxypeptidase n=1 Tax=Cylindrodendrum hubeiense TaxID=595255 RepID=A0A9P5HFF5_9HYPO|nr:hypothetical protein G7Z17_g1112 [Cylindrodendrum hubeiense]
MVLWLARIFATLVPSLITNGGSVNVSSNVEVFNETKTVQYLSNSNWCGKDTPNHTGFIKVGLQNENSKMWFWMFHRREALFTAPLILYMGGSPGIAASQGMLDGTGPCIIPDKGDESSNNEFHSLNQWANILYVDAPIGTGFSKGNSYIDTRELATEYMVEFLQKFFNEFPNLRNSKFGIWGVDYGAHFATSLAVDILKKNKEAKVEGYTGDWHDIPLDSIGFDSPRLDLILQHKAAIDYAYENGWVEVITKPERDAFLDQFSAYEKGWRACSKQMDWRCNEEIQEHKALWKNLTSGWDGDLDLENILKPRPDYGIAQISRMMNESRETNWLRSKKTQEELRFMDGKINSQLIDYTPYNVDMHNRFWASGDVIRSSLPGLDVILQAGIRTLFISGDTDFTTNHIGISRIAEGIKHPGQTAFKDAPTSKVEWDHGQIVEGDVVGAATMIKTGGNITVVNAKGVGHYLGKRDPVAANGNEDRSKSAEHPQRHNKTLSMFVSLIFLLISWISPLNRGADASGAISQLASSVAATSTPSRPSHQTLSASNSHPSCFASFSSASPPTLDNMASQAQGKNLGFLKQHLTPELLKGVRDFWFEPFEKEDDYILPQRSHAMRWYAGGKELDGICVKRFAPALEAIHQSGATTGEDILSVVQPRAPLDWLGIILLLDQISRNCYRGDESKIVYGFYDVIAQQIALAAIEQGVPDQDPEIRWHFAYRNWFYMPLMHSESLSHHEAAVTEFGLLVKDVYSLVEGPGAPGASELEKLARDVVQRDVEAAKSMADNNMLFEKKHADIIKQFGRYPHRNAAMGREPTAAETGYLENGGERFSG